MTTEQKLIEKYEELVHLLDTEPDDYNREIDNKESNLRKEIDALKKEMQGEDDELKDELMKFLKWFESLSPASKCTVHPPAGSGGSYGIYNLTDAALVNIYLSKTQQPSKTR